MRTKHIELDHHVQTGELTVQYVDPRDTRMAKYASYCDESLGALRVLTPEPGHTHALVIAMTAFEYYGFNRNGDGFNERQLARTTCDGRWQILVHEDQSLPYYYKTFETSGNNFLNHKNKDPLKRVGKIVRAFYNWKMHRVEVIIAVANDRAFRVVERLKDGDFPAVSMGCHIPYDVCYVCGNRAPTRAQYCEHASGYDPRYGLTTILEDGTECGVLNPCPDLFDLSWVFKPADRVAYTISSGGIYVPAPSTLQAPTGDLVGLTVATAKHAGVDRSDDPWRADVRMSPTLVSPKMAALDKLSVMDKYVHGDLAGIGHAMPALELAAQFDAPFEPMTTTQVQTAAQHSIPDVVATCNDLSIAPSTDDIYRVLCVKADVAPDPGVRAVLGSIRSAILRAFHGPGLLDMIFDDLLPGLHAGCHQPKLAACLAPLIEKRALAEDYLLRKYVPESIGNAVSAIGHDPTNAYYGSPQGKLTIRNPDTGEVYETQRLTAEKTDLSNKKRQAAEVGTIAGMAALGAGALSVLPGAGRAKALRLPVLGLGGYGAYEAGTTPVKTVRADDGTDVPINTPMVKTNSVLGTDLGLAMAWAQDAHTCIPEFTKQATIALHDVRDRHFTRIDGLWHAPGIDKLAFVTDVAATLATLIDGNFLAYRRRPA